MTLEEAPSYAAFLAKKAEVQTSQQSAGFQAPATVALSKEAADLLVTCTKEAGIPSPRRG